MSRKKISTTIYVTPEQNDRLKLLHERTKVPVAVYIREGIDMVLRQYEHLLPGQLPLGSAARSAVSAASAVSPVSPVAEAADADDSDPISQAGASAPGGRPAHAAAMAATGAKK